VSAPRCTLVAAVVAAVLAAGPAGATDVTPERLRALAEEASRDPSALAELRRVDSVDGRPVDVERLLAGARERELEGRLRVLAEEGGSSGGGTAAEARRTAREILSERRFEDRGPPRPFREPLEWLSDRLRGAVDPLLDRVAPHVPGGRSTVWTIVALAVIALAGFLGSRLVRRRAAEAAGRAREAVAGPTDPRRLERDADEAERRGELERALRLRFRAGLLRLQRAEAIPSRDSLTSGEVSRRLRSRDFDRIAETFDEVVYGGRRPGPADVESSRAGWSRVLETAGAR
jgi:Domain of unknown function (DUF4129)